MYAFAVLLNELMTELMPYPDCLNMFQISHSVTGSGLRPASMKPDDNDAIGKELLSLVRNCWDQDPALRMGFHELATELTHLWRKAVERAQQGNHAAPLTPPPPAPPARPPPAPAFAPPPKVAESDIAALSTWLTSCCHVNESDAMSLAHALVTVKGITSHAVLAQVLHRSPDYLTKEMHQSVVLEAQVCTALSISPPISPTPPKPTTAAISTPTPSTKLAALTSFQLCALFDHCYLSRMKTFVTEHDLTGMSFDSLCVGVSMVRFIYFVFVLCSRC